MPAEGANDDVVVAAWPNPWLILGKQHLIQMLT